MKSIHLNLLKIGAIQTILIAVYHFFIPFQFNWREFITEGVPTINWSLFALNNYFSFNLLVIALFLLYYLYSKKIYIEVIKILSLIAMLFWSFSALYQIIEPMPLPVSLSWLGFVLPGLALVNILIFMVPLKEFIKIKIGEKYIA